MQILQASKHQGHFDFKGCGRQCVANAVHAILKRHEIQPDKWSSQHLDEILEKGDRLYVQLQQLKQVNHLAIDEIPSEIDSKELLFLQPLSGTIQRADTEYPFYSLKDAVNLMTDGSNCILTMGSTEPSYSSAMILRQGVFYFVDSHSRDSNSMPAADKFATMTVHHDIDSVCCFIKTLSKSLFGAEINVPFELSFLIVSDHSSDCNSEFSEFGSFSEGEYDCRLYLKYEEIEEMNTPDVSDVSTPNVSDLSISSSFSMSSYISDIANELMNDSSTFIDKFDESTLNNFADINNDIEQGTGWGEAVTEETVKDHIVIKGTKKGDKVTECIERGDGVSGVERVGIVSQEDGIGDVVTKLFQGTSRQSEIQASDRQSEIQVGSDQSKIQASDRQNEIQTGDRQKNEIQVGDGQSKIQKVTGLSEFMTVGRKQGETEKDCGHSEIQANSGQCEIKADSGQNETEANSGQSEIQADSGQSEIQENSGQSEIPAVSGKNRCQVDSGQSAIPAVSGKSGCQADGGQSGCQADSGQSGCQADSGQSEIQADSGQSAIREVSGKNRCQVDSGQSEIHADIEQTWFQEGNCRQREVGVNSRMNEEGDDLDKNDTITDSKIPENLGNLNNSTEFFQDTDLDR